MVFKTSNFYSIKNLLVLFSLILNILASRGMIEFIQSYKFYHLFLQVALMDPVQSDKDSNIQIPVWDKYKEIVKQREGPNVGQRGTIKNKNKLTIQVFQVCVGVASSVMLLLQVEIEFVERFAFYDRAKTAYAIVHTG